MRADGECDAPLVNSSSRLTFPYVREAVAPI
jgi:hypothetical protein